MSKKLYLTIDDSPSSHTSKKVDFLKRHSIPAVFFCRGEYIPSCKDQVIYILQQGYLIGNHSYSHPYFSKISLEAAQEEILKTEELLEECHALAGVPRFHKVIRFPFGDPGTPTTAPLLQTFLGEKGFTTLDFGSLTPLDRIDAVWTWGPKDYKEILIKNPDCYLQEFITAFHTRTQKREILLLHDFKTNHELFERAMSFLLQQEVEFLKINAFNKN